jgi:long-chain acyl-CoA synthetase
MSELGFWNFAQSAPEKLALVDPQGREWTRGELFAESNKIAHGLRAAGLERGDCVALVMPNCWEFFAIHLAVTQIGLYMTPINNHLTGPEIAYIVKD